MVRSQVESIGRPVVLACGLIVALLAGSARAQAQQPALEAGPLREAGPSVPLASASPDAFGVVIGEPAPVVVWNREIVQLRAALGHLTAALRARQAAERVLSIPETSLSRPVKVQPVALGTVKGFSFSVQEQFLFTVCEQDVDAERGETLESTVESVRRRLEEVLHAQRSQRSLSLILRSAGLTVAATVVLLALLWLIAMAKRWTVRTFRLRVARSERLRVRDIDLRPYVAEAFERLVGLFNLIVLGAVTYVWLGFCLALFPYTAPWGDALGAYLSGMLAWMFHAVVGAVPDLGFILIIFFITRGIARTISLVVGRIERRAERTEGVAPESVRATRRLAVVVVWIFGLVLAYPHIPGAESDAFKGISVLLGVMVSLGSAGLVNQVMSGFVVLYSRSVRSGEVVRIGDVEGQVVDLGLLTTKVLRPSGEEVSIPNAVVVMHTTTNFSRGPGDGRAVASTTVTIGYDTPWRQVRALLLLAAERTEGIVRDPAPRVAQVALSDWYAEYALIFLVEDGKQRAAVLSRLNATIQDAFNEYGVQIMSPHYRAQPEAAVLVPRGGEEPEPAPRFRFAKEAPPASFDPVKKAAEERAARAAEEAAKAERARLRAEREAPGDAADSGPAEGEEPDEEPGEGGVAGS